MTTTGSILVNAKFELLDGAITPKRVKRYYKLYSPVDVTIGEKETAVIDTRVKILPDDNTCSRFIEREHLAASGLRVEKYETSVDGCQTVTFKNFGAARKIKKRDGIGRVLCERIVYFS